MRTPLHRQEDRGGKFGQAEATKKRALVAHSPLDSALRRRCGARLPRISARFGSVGGRRFDRKICAPFCSYYATAAASIPRSSSPPQHDPNRPRLCAPDRRLVHLENAQLVALVVLKRAQRPRRDYDRSNAARQNLQRRRLGRPRHLHRHRPIFRSTRAARARCRRSLPLDGVCRPPHARRSDGAPPACARLVSFGRVDETKVGQSTKTNSR